MYESLREMLKEAEKKDKSKVRWTRSRIARCSMRVADLISSCCCVCIVSVDHCLEQS